MMKFYNKYIAHTGLRWIWVAVIVFIIDRVSKTLVLAYLDTNAAYQIFPFLNFILAFNKGAAFSFLNNASGWQGWLFGLLAIFVSLAVLVRLKQVSHEQSWLSIGLALIVGGALGNLTDRIMYGRVIDFIGLHAGPYYWPIFNLSDSAICIGAFMLFLDVLFSKQRAHRK